jgi:tetratricopeptide (TPR) repeat protein
MATRLRAAGLLLAAVALGAQAQDVDERDPWTEFLAEADAREEIDQRVASLAAIESAIRAEGKKGVEGLRRRAAWRLRDGDLEGALGDLDRALERAPRDPTLLLQRAVVRGRLPGEAEAAQEDLAEALRLDEGFIEAMLVESERRRAAGETDLADGYLAKAGERAHEAEGQGRGVPVAWARARLARLAGDVEEERAALTQADDLWEAWTEVEARYRLCLDLPSPSAWRATLMEQLAEVSALAELEAGHPRRRARHGLALAEARDYAKAIPELEAALAGDPTLCEAGLMLAWLVERREPERAAKLLDVAVEAAPDARLRCAARVARAALRERTNDRPGALADLDEALQQRPDDAKALYSRGRLRFDLGAGDKAEEDFTAALLVAPGNAWAWYYRGQCRSRR